MAPAIAAQAVPKGPATRNDFVNDIVDDARADAIFSTLKTIVDDGSSTISSTISLRVAGPLVGVSRYNFTNVYFRIMFCIYIE